MEGGATVRSDTAAIRCAKAALLVSSLRSSSCFSSSIRVGAVTVKQESSPTQEEKEIQDLKMKLVRERLRSKRNKLCGSIELAIQVWMLLLSLATLIILLGFVHL
ncbi:hypothetical protein LINPERPRIM_LOCUS42510 [Linum perenne]